MKHIASLAINNSAPAPAPSAPKTGQPNAGVESSPIPAWIDELLAKLHAIYGMKWTNHVGAVPYEALRSTWGEAMAGWTKLEAKRALDYCRDTMPWPPALPDFIAARRAGMTDEQAAFQARLDESNQERLALPSKTWAERKAEGARACREIMAKLRQGAAEREQVRAAEADESVEPVSAEQIARMEAAKRQALDALARMQAERGNVA